MKSILMPRLGLTMEEGTVTQWLIAEGDSFQEGQIIFEIMTDKATNEVAAGFSGKLTKILVHENENAKVGEPIAEAE
jgi:pyruvate/2-oxoglutarate dehydrogenase complex dihydrolipoamide acyltransferase (E2) component